MNCKRRYEKDCKCMRSKYFQKIGAFFRKYLKRWFKFRVWNLQVVLSGSGENYFVRLNRFCMKYLWAKSITPSVKLYSESPTSYINLDVLFYHRDSLRKFMRFYCRIKDSRASESNDSLGMKRMTLFLPFLVYFIFWENVFCPTVLPVAFPFFHITSSRWEKKNSFEWWKNLLNPY